MHNMKECKVEIQKMSQQKCCEFFNETAFENRMNYIATIKQRYEDLLSRIQVDRNIAACRSLEDKCFEQALKLFEPDIDKQNEFLKSASEHVKQWRTSMSYSFRSCSKAKELEEQLWELRQYFQLQLETEDLFNENLTFEKANEKVYVNNIIDLIGAMDNRTISEPSVPANKTIISCENNPKFITRLHHSSFNTVSSKNKNLPYETVNLPNNTKSNSSETSNNQQTLPKNGDLQNKMLNGKQTNKHLEEGGIFASFSLENFLQKASKRFKFEDSAEVESEVKPVEENSSNFIKPWQDVVLKNKSNLPTDKSLNEEINKPEQVPTKKIMSIKEKLKNMCKTQNISECSKDTIFSSDANNNLNTNNNSKLPPKSSEVAKALNEFLKHGNEPVLDQPVTMTKKYKRVKSKKLSDTYSSVFLLHSEHDWFPAKKKIMEIFKELNRLKFIDDILTSEKIFREDSLFFLDITCYGVKPLRYFTHIPNIPGVVLSQLEDMSFCNYYEVNFKLRTGGGGHQSQEFKELGFENKFWIVNPPDDDLTNSVTQMDQNKTQDVFNDNPLSDNGTAINEEDGPLKHCDCGMDLENVDVNSEKNCGAQKELTEPIKPKLSDTTQPIDSRVMPHEDTIVTEPDTTMNDIDLKTVSQPAENVMTTANNSTKEMSPKCSLKSSTLSDICENKDDKINLRTLAASRNDPSLEILAWLKTSSENMALYNESEFDYDVQQKYNPIVSVEKLGPNLDFKQHGIVNLDEIREEINLHFVSPIVQNKNQSTKTSSSPKVPLQYLKPKLIGEVLSNNNDDKMSESMFSTATVQNRNGPLKWLSTATSDDDLLSNNSVISRKRSIKKTNVMPKPFRRISQESNKKQKFYSNSISSSKLTSYSDEISYYDMSDEEDDIYSLLSQDEKNLKFNERFKKWKIQQQLKLLRQAIGIPGTSFISTLAQATDCIHFLKAEDEMLISEKDGLLKQNQKLLIQKDALYARYATLTDFQKANDNIRTSTVLSYN